MAFLERSLSSSQGPDYSGKNSGDQAFLMAELGGIATCWLLSFGLGCGTDLVTEGFSQGHQMRNSPHLTQLVSSTASQSFGLASARVREDVPMQRIGFRVCMQSLGSHKVISQPNSPPSWGSNFTVEALDLLGSEKYEKFSQ